MSAEIPSGLYGIKHSNRQGEQHWSKNCFNSSFPAALACYMMDNNIPAIYAKLANVNGNLQIVCDEIPISELFNCDNRRSEDLSFCFEEIFEPYQQYSFDTIDGIDLVIRSLDGEYLAPVEVKLTVLPSSGTAEKPEQKWGSELVVRTATTSYCAFSIWDSVKGMKRDVREIFEHECSNIGSWTNDFEMTHKTEQLKQVVDVFEAQYINYQRPLIMQPFWKTQGQTPLLCDNAFDIVVWSNLAFSRLFIDTALNPNKMSRPMRAIARLARAIWELSKSEKLHVDEIYRQMAFGQQTDKEFSISGDLWRKYITTDRTITPAVSKKALSTIIAPGFIENLKPERRFDQTLYFMYRSVVDNESTN